MIRIKNFSLLRWISLALILSAALILVYELISFSRLRSGFSLGTTIADVPVGGLTLDEAADRLTQAYSVPVELHYNDAVIQVKPATLGFSLDLNAMITAADQKRSSSPFWSSFFNYLFNRYPDSSSVPLVATINEDTLRDYLNSEIAPRYDQAPDAYSPVPGGTTFVAGQAGSVLNVDRSVQLVSMALRSPTSRIVNLSVDKVDSSKPSQENLKVLLKQIIDNSGFTGVAEIYLLDLQTQQELQLAYQQGEELAPNIAFSAASTIKVPIMVSVFKDAKKPISSENTALLEEMIETSSNTAPDKLMQSVIDPNLAPVMITNDLEALGLENIFLGGMFADGSALLISPKTTANQRTDINTNPDVYSQTTPADMGSLLDDIYQCAQNGGGTFAAVFPQQITQSDCRTMILYLTRNDQPGLLREGLPDGTQIAHKHGWVTDNTTDGLMHLVSDAGIVYTPGGNYIMAVYLADTRQVVWDTANYLIASLSRAVYNYYNLSAQ
ncbi:MAG: serine hydrolase [Anaerolineaceae bacterium]|nr:serine hydrolase [Anaerolineaceae bacterium]